jgi:hypothetical protein
MFVKLRSRRNESRRVLTELFCVALRRRIIHAMQQIRKAWSTQLSYCAEITVGVHLMHFALDAQSPTVTFKPHKALGGLPAA